MEVDDPLPELPWLLPWDELPLDLFRPLGELDEEEVFKLNRDMVDIDIVLTID